MGIGVLRVRVYHLQYTQASEEGPSSSESVQFCQESYLRPKWQMLTAVSAMKALTSEEERVAFRSLRHIFGVSSIVFLRNVRIGMGIATSIRALNRLGYMVHRFRPPTTCLEHRRSLYELRAVECGGTKKRRRHKCAGPHDSTRESSTLHHADSGSVGSHSCQRPSRPVFKTRCAVLPGVFSAAEMAEVDAAVDNEGIETHKLIEVGLNALSWWDPSL